MPCVVKIRLNRNRGPVGPISVDVTTAPDEQIRDAVVIPRPDDIEPYGLADKGPDEVKDMAPEDEPG